MSLITKIKNSIEARGLNCIYDSLGMINQKLDYSSYPLAFFTLIKEGGLISVNGVYREVANIAVFFVKPSTFDFESLENEQIIDECKTLALGWLDSLKWGGVLRAEVLRTDRLYNYADSILTGYALNLRISELEGEGCLNPLIPDSRKCEVILTSEEGGTVEGSGTYILNTTCTISATPDSSHRFIGWYIGEDLISTEPTYTFTITESGTLNINGVFEVRKLVVNCINPFGYIVLTNVNGDEYTVNLSIGENVYEGDVEGFEIDNITNLRVAGHPVDDYNISFIDAHELTSWTTIKTNSFKGCQYLTTIILPDTITTIEDRAIQGCTRMEYITLPASITNIGYQAMNVNQALTSITCLATTPPTLGISAFYYTNNCPIYVPADSVNAYKTANRWSSYADRIQAITE